MLSRQLVSLPVAIVVLAAALSLTACSAPAGASSTTSTESSSAAVSGDTSPTIGPIPAGDKFGCTDAMLGHMTGNGYPNATPQDPSGFSFPEGVTVAAVPACYVVDETSGALRSGAMFTGDVNMVLGEIGSALTAAGYVQSSDYGPYMWWVGGDDPTTATHAVGAASQPIDGADVIWATW